MQLVIELPTGKQKQYNILIKQNGCFMATGNKFPTKAQAIAYCKDKIFNSIEWYLDRVLIFKDTEEAYDNGTMYTELKIGKPRK